jgi:hypothetical protein
MSQIGGGQTGSPDKTRRTGWDIKTLLKES